MKEAPRPSGGSVTSESDMLLLMMRSQIAAVEEAVRREVWTQLGGQSWKSDFARVCKLVAVMGASNRRFLDVYGEFPPPPRPVRVRTSQRAPP